ncbi:MAG: carboxypeptidase-like regulatory domain-containing protein [Planctomycetia bacterium]
MNSKILIGVALVVVAGGAFFLFKPKDAAPDAPRAIEAVAEDAGPDAQRPPAELDAPELAETDSVGDARSVVATEGESKPAAATPKKSSELVLLGRVVDESGAPVAGAEVKAAAAQGGPEFGLDEIDADMFGGWIVVDSATSGADGRFELPLRRKANTVQFAARKAGFAPLEQRFDVQPGRHEVGDVRLARGAVVAGRVVNSSGRGVAGAAVHRKRVGGDMMAQFNPFPGPVVATTDAAGAFVVDQLAIGDYKLVVKHAEHPDGALEGSTSQGSERISGLEVRLADGAAIMGVVSGLEGKWTEDLRVAATKAGGGAFGMPDFTGGRRAKVDKDGGFRISGLSADTSYRLAVVRGDKPNMTQMMGGRRGRDGVEAKSGDVGVRVPLVDETALVGQVVDARTKAPLTQLRVEAGRGWLVPLADEKGKPQSNFPEGRFRHANLVRMGSGGKLDLKVVADGYRTFEQKGIEVPDGATTDIGVIELEPAPLARVVVLDATTRQPVANAKVNLEVLRDEQDGNRVFVSGGDDDDDGMPMMPSGETRTGKSGADGVAMVAMEPGKRMRAVVRAKGRAEWTGTAFVAPADGEQSIEALLVEGGTVVVKVVDTSGAPVPKVAVEREEDDSGVQVFAMGGDRKTNSKGELEFKNLLPGPQRFRVKDGGMFGGARMGRARMARNAGADGAALFDMGGDEEPQWSSVEVADKGRHEVVLVVPARATLVGVVREGGKPVAGLRVKVSDGDDMEFGFGGESGAKTDADGRFELADVEAGKQKLVVSGPRRAMNHEQEIEIYAGDNKVEIDLPSATIEGRVVSVDGAPMAGAKVKVMLAPEGSFESAAVEFAAVVAFDGGDAEGGVMEFGAGQGNAATTDAQGRYTLRGVRAGAKLVVEVKAKDCQPKRGEPFELAIDEARTGMDFVVQPGCTLEVSLRSADGRQRGFFARAVKLDDKGDEGAEQSSQFAQRASTKLSGLAPGRWRVTVNPVSFGEEDGGQDEDPAPKEIELKVGQKNELVFDG